MNEVVVGLFMLAIVVMIGASKFRDMKKEKAREAAQKAFEAAQKVIKDQIASLEAKLAALKK